MHQCMSGYVRVHMRLPRFAVVVSLVRVLFFYESHDIHIVLSRLPACGDEGGACPS